MNRSLSVLGMHRSGTSALMGTLRDAGVYLGEVFDNGFPLNPKGLQEPRSLIYMHEDLLNKNGGSWKSPPSEITWGDLHLAIRNLFIESRQSHSIWGFKEPRTLLVLDGWNEALPQLEYVGVFRHPFEVALSLQKRNALNIDEGLSLWNTYNLKLLNQYETKPFPILEFHQNSKAVKKGLEYVCNSLGLEFSPNGCGDTFFDSNMRTIKETPADDLPSNIQDTYARLLSLSCNSHNRYSQA